MSNNTKVLESNSCIDNRLMITRRKSLLSHAEKLIRETIEI